MITEGAGLSPRSYNPDFSPQFTLGHVWEQSGGRRIPERQPAERSSDRRARRRSYLQSPPSSLTSTQPEQQSAVTSGNTQEKPRFRGESSGDFGGASQESPSFVLPDRSSNSEY
ncbi:hypothetical protein KSP39_PZI005731 [Platanthera zijinensis]|uniref:Uncharacterized protein n=1 Tax=Platanthera zijinensis TaxID=2320716 RepID=A0AAP0BTL7_9ASPA